MEHLQAVKGMNDILPDEIGEWRFLETMFRQHLGRYGYNEVRTPIVEPTALFMRSIGETTDIVEKEMYTFTDKGENTLTLRPEGTASAVRAYLQHSIAGLEPITKWMYLGPMFRRERPAKGRYRQFYQAGAEFLGDAGPYSDAEMIDMAEGFLSAIGITDIEVVVNSLGGPETRPAYRESLVAYLQPLREALCGDCQRRIDTNPLRVLDCKVPHDQEVAKNAPSVTEFLSPDDRAHFDGLRRTLDKLKTPYRVDTHLVRGLDYYTRTLFEIKGRGGGLGAQATVCGGGRYDGLVEQLGGQKTPAIGFAMGIERLLLMQTKQPQVSRFKACIVAASANEIPDAAALASSLRNEYAMNVELDLRGQSMKSQLRRADKLGAEFAVILGENEIARGVVQVKNLINKTQADVPRDELVSHLNAFRRETP